MRAPRTSAIRSHARNMKILPWRICGWPIRPIKMPRSIWSTKLRRRGPAPNSSSSRNRTTRTTVSRRRPARSALLQQHVDLDVELVLRRGHRVGLVFLDEGPRRIELLLVEVFWDGVVDGVFHLMEGTLVGELQ